MNDDGSASETRHDGSASETRHDHDDIDARLHAYATRWFPASPQPAAATAPRGRNWLPVAAAASVLALVAGVAIAVQRNRAPAQVSTGSSTPTSTTASSSGVVPWADAPVPATALSEGLVLPVAPADPSARLCTAGDLAIEVKVYPGAGQPVGVEMDVVARNISAIGCDINVKPGVALRADGQSLPVDSWMTTEGRSGPTYLPIGRHAITHVSWVGSYCGPRPTAYDVVLTWTDVHLTTRAQPSAVYPPCRPSQPEHNVSSTWFDVVPDTTTMPAFPKLSLPATVARGTRLHYEVTLTNPQDGAYDFQPCPAYAQQFRALGPDASASSADEQTNRLNCADAAPIPAGGSRVFAMELEVPAAAPLGKATVTWRLGFRGANATADLVVT